MMTKKLNVLLVNSVKSMRRFSLFESNNNSSSNNNKATFESYLSAKIKLKGPLTVAEFMKEALGNPKWVCFFKFYIIPFKIYINETLNKISLTRVIT